MFLLFFLMVAAGMLSLLWIYFPMMGGPPPDPRPAYPTAAVATRASPEAAAVPDALPPSAPDAPAGAEPGAAAVTGDPALPRPEDTVPRAAPGGAGSASPERIDFEDLRRQLERLLGDTLPPGR
jgi:hypothetical protein